MSTGPNVFAAKHLPRHGDADYEHCPRCNAHGRGMGTYYCDHPGVGDAGWKSSNELKSELPNWQEPHAVRHFIQPIWVEYQSVTAPWMLNPRVILHLEMDCQEEKVFASLKDCKPEELTEKNGFFKGELIRVIGRLPDDEEIISWIMYQSGKKMLCSGPVTMIKQTAAAEWPKLFVEEQTGLILL